MRKAVLQPADTLASGFSQEMLMRSIEFPSYILSMKTLSYLADDLKNY
jgi:hypothetical protein